jgi:hypothetical protein
MNSNQTALLQSCAGQHGCWVQHLRTLTVQGCGRIRAWLPAACVLGVNGHLQSEQQQAADDSMCQLLRNNEENTVS